MAGGNHKTKSVCERFRNQISQNQFWSHGDTKVGERVISLIGLCENGPLVEEEQKLEPSEVAENRQKRNKTKKVSKKTEIKNNIAG